MNDENNNENLFEMIEKVYTFDDIEELIPWFFTTLNVFLPIQAGAYIPCKSGTYMLQKEGAIGYNFSDESIRVFFDKFMSKLPLYSVPASIKRMAPNKGIRVNKMLPDKLYRRMEIYKKYFEPMGIYWVMPSLLVANNTAVGGLALHRSEKHSFSREDKAMYNRIAPHLARAIILCSTPEKEQGFTLYETLKSFGLSKRQKGVTKLLLQGLSNREIASQLYITEQTVRDHLCVVYRKMSVTSRSQLIVLLSKKI